MPPSYDSLYLQSSRRSTFHKTRKGALRSQNWPLPLTAAASKTSSIHPDHLAQAGFYSTPNHDDPTVTTCFACEVVVGKWEEGEDPLARHLAAAEESELECPWVIIQEASWEKTDGLDGKDPETEWEPCWGEDGKMHPRGEFMQRARKGTFALGWPHHGEKGVPTPEELASAGWYFRPGTTTDSADQTFCLYCLRTVTGWEEGDDPVECHNRKIGEGCPFFLAPLPGTSKSAPSKSKRSKASTASSALTSTTAKKEKSKKGKKVVQKVVEEESEEADVEQEEEETPQEENEPEPQPRTRATRSASVSASAPIRQTRRAKATPAPSEDETDSAVATQALKKSTRSRTTATTTNPPTVKSTSRSRKAGVDIDVEVEVELPAVPAPEPESATASASSSKSSKKAALPSSTSSGSSKSKSKKTVTSPVEEDEESGEAVQWEEAKKEEEEAQVRPRTGQLTADESITDLAMIANAAYELQPSSTEEVEVKKPAKKSKSKSKASKASVASSSSSKGKSKAQEEVVEAEPAKDAEIEGEKAIELAKPEEKIAVAETRTQSLPVKTSAPSPPVQDAISPSTSTRQIRSLPSKVNPSKSPSSTSLSAKAGPTSPLEAIPPVPTVSLPAKSTSSLPLPWSASTSPKETDNPFAPNRILQLLPPPSKEEESTLTVEGWYDLLGRRVYSALKQEMDQMQQVIEKRVEEGRVKLRGMCDEAKAREDAEDRAIEEKRRQKKADKLQASARKHGSARKAVR